MQQLIADGNTVVSTPVPQSAQNALKARLLRNVPDRYIYHEDRSKCLRQMIQYTLAEFGERVARTDNENGDSRDWKAFLKRYGKFDFAALYPNLPVLSEESVLNAYNQERKRWAKYPGVRVPATLLWFVVEQQVREAIPPQALIDKKQGNLTYAEPTMVFRTGKTLCLKNERRRKQQGKPPYPWRMIPHSYFLGKDYQKSKNAAVRALHKLPATATPQAIFAMGFRAGVEAAAAINESQKKHDYLKQYSSATSGRKLNKSKLTRIMNLLVQANLLDREYRQSENRKHCVRVWYALGSKGRIVPGGVSADQAAA